MSQARAGLLETLRAQTAQVTLAELRTLTGLHENTIREHLDALHQRGLVQRHRAQPNGRGRPAWLYEASPGDKPEQSEYAGLATALASTLHRTSASPRDDAIVAGQEWGRELARDRGRRPDEAAGRAVIDLLGGLGFGPETDGSDSEVRLTRCPLLDTAYRYPDVVCGVHLGIVRGAMKEYGADPLPVELAPFAEPGACRLHLAGRPQPEQP